MCIFSFQRHLHTKQIAHQISKNWGQRKHKHTTSQQSFNDSFRTEYDKHKFHWTKKKKGRCNFAYNFSEAPWSTRKLCTYAALRTIRSCHLFVGYKGTMFPKKKKNPQTITYKKIYQKKLCSRSKRSRWTFWLLLFSFNITIEFQNGLRDQTILKQ